MNATDTHKNRSTQQPVFHPVVDGLPHYTLYSGSQKTHQTQPYLPIEYFRDHGFIQQLFQGLDLGMRFLSSGTTASTRSHSIFSKQGLDKYQTNSVANFIATLHQWIPAGTTGLQGFSLVPPPSEWPESSLAQMVSWIGAVTPVTYCTADSLAEVVSRHIQENPSAPCWLFGTAFHFVQRADAGFPRLPLPPGSVVFETGGTKGKSRSVSQEELEALLIDSFQVSPSHIISEYGMCELQCQAYSLPPIESMGLETRWMRFPPSVMTSVMTGPGQCASSGRGLLMVSDPDRLDLPWPIRTEDLVELRPDGAIRLLGRAPKTPLKGCSLNVNEIEPSPKPTLPPLRLSPLERQYPTRSAPTLDQRIHGLQQFLSGCSQQMLLQALTREFGSEPAAILCWNDLFDRFPSASTAPDFETSRGPWLKIMQHAFGDTKASSDHWLFLLPENHSVVGVYPLLIAYLCGLKISVRLPRSFADPHSFLNLFLADCTRLLPGLDMEICPPSLRLDPRLPAPFDKILVYGSDSTVDLMERSYPGMVQGFGHRWAMSVIVASDLHTLGHSSTSSQDKAVIPSDHIAEMIFRDFFSLDQRGCRSSRLLLVLDGDQSPRFLDADVPRGRWIVEMLSPLINSAPQDTLMNQFVYSDLASEIPRSISMEFEACRLRRLGYQVSWDGLLFAYQELPHELSMDVKDLNLEPLGAMTPGTLPILISNLNSPEALLKVARMLRNQTHLGQIGFSPAAQGLLQPIINELTSTSEEPPAIHDLFESHLLGKGNRQIWNGLHQSRPLWCSFSAANPSSWPIKPRL